MLLGTLPFLNPNRGFFFFFLRYYTNIIFTKQPDRGHEFHFCGFYSVEYEICSLHHIFISFPSKVFQCSDCKTFMALNLSAHKPCKCSLAVMTKP